MLNESQLDAYNMNTNRFKLISYYHLKQHSKFLNKLSNQEWHNLHNNIIDRDSRIYWHKTRRCQSPYSDEFITIAYNLCSCGSFFRFERGQELI